MLERWLTKTRSWRSCSRIDGIKFARQRASSVAGLQHFQECCPFFYQLAPVVQGLYERNDGQIPDGESRELPVWTVGIC